jgi:NAD+ diphosphatase
VTDEASDVPALHYAGMPLDRAQQQRRDPAWLRAARTAATSRAVLLHDGLVAVDERPAAVLVPLASVPGLDDAGRVPPVLLGVDDADRAVYAVDLTPLSEADAAKVINAERDARFADLRELNVRLPIPDAALLAHARGMVEFHRTYRFCVACGGQTRMAESGELRRCVADDCAREVYPRVDPVVIVLVEHPATAERPAALLLGGSDGGYSLLAGFVEPGESFEETAAREIHEESGVAIDEIRYLATQPWPFAGQVMVGMRARASSERIVVDLEELGDAAWFTAAQLREFGEPGDDLLRRLPRRDAIGRVLIDAWLAEQP